MLRAVAPAAESADLLAGPSGFDDAGAVRLAGGRVGLYTVDFFPPVVDDLVAYGAVAAANSLSDVYACGGEARVVLNLAGFPEEWDEEVLQPVFEAAVDKVREAGALWVGGHSVRSKEPLFGFAVFGEVEEQHLVTNEAARPGDLLYLSKPLGSGSITTGVKRELARAEDVTAAVAGMSRLNRGAAQAMRAAGVRAATDVTGFGLLGHAANLARGSAVALVFEAGNLPLYSGAEDLARHEVFSGGSKRGRAALAGVAEVGTGVPDWLAALCYDAETSGGLLACVPPERERDFVAGFGAEPAPACVGRVEAGDAAVRLEGGRS